MKDYDLIVLPGQLVTANVTSPTFDLGEGAQLVAGQWAPNYGGAPMKLVVPVTSYNAPAGGNQTYSAVVNESSDGATWTPASPVRTPAGDGVPVSGGVLALGFFSRKRYVQLVITVGGTTPSIVLGDCYIEPITNRFGA